MSQEAYPLQDILSPHSILTIYFRFGSYVSTTTPEPNVCD